MILLFFAFVSCGLFTVFAGGRVYENIGRRIKGQYTDNVALSYIANKVRQGDEKDMVRVIKTGDVSVLELEEEWDGVDYKRWIYYYDGSIRELFARPDTKLGPEDGIPVLECSGLFLSQAGRLLTVETGGEEGGRLMLSLRSGGDGE